MYLYLFRSYIQSAGIQTPIRETCLGSLTSVIDTLTDKYPVVTKQDCVETPIIGLSLRGFYSTNPQDPLYCSDTVTDWLSFLKAMTSLTKGPVALKSFCDADCIYNLVLVDGKSHARLSRRYHSFNVSFNQKHGTSIKLSVSKQGQTDSILLHKEYNSIGTASVKDIEEFLNKYTRSLSIDHCVRQFVLKQHEDRYKSLKGLKTFEEDSVKITIEPYSSLLISRSNVSK